ncbi:glycine cleavage T C-terminal barrel domain-containing protein [Salinibacterium sp. G-O1]|uniref:CAF17-like 4Fe-4S cluster assembly/insertion protein YgfZ n=1 Tax=Salinibacterium sp. G-O1 TaxID=3046208 RepID=UPI0024BAF486|nr:glycine cleavage T C-terminal barrel domain-containing protein [Salinibacterium sp. G-O1]MDJ0336013.1 glycine cleavage T C-terminal barrel domain-containing protein [Salinibacterium sp. G-O1]
MSNDFAARPGAVGDPPQHYGNPLSEQKALASGEAIVDLSDRAVITVTGPDRLTWLDSLTSQAVAKLAPGESAETLLLDPSGRVEHAMRLVDDGETAWLLVDANQGAKLTAWLDRMRFMLRVEVADRTADFATVGTLGTQELPAVATWRDPWADGPGHTYAATRPDAPWSYSEVLVERGADLSAFPAAGSLALEALRIAAWRPRLATEGDEKTIPHELDWLRSAVHLAKGCYRGQETVAKVHNLGHPPRRIVMLHLDGSDGVHAAAGSPVLLGDAEVGRVTSAALHYELGPIALAVVKRSVDPAAELVVRVDETLIAAAQDVIVPTDAGASANVPRLPRLGAVRR